jgi:hypothetical protein
MVRTDDLNTRIYATAEEFWILIMFQTLSNVHKLDALINLSLSESFRE